MSDKKINIFNIPIDCISMQKTLDIIEEAIKNKKQIHHVAVNAYKIVLMQKDKELHNSVVNCDLINADGQSVVWASKILGKPLPERVTGIDLMNNLVKLSFQNHYKIYFFGAKEEIVSKVVMQYSQNYSSEIIAGYRNGYYEESEKEIIAKNIAESKADILFVAINSPKKEKFLDKYKHTIKIPFIMGVGGSFDVVAGFTKRAPYWMQKTGLEWLYRFIQEPKRMWKRYLIGNFQFVFLVARELIKNKKL